MLLDIPNVHRPAHDPNGVKAVERRIVITLVELDCLPADAVLREKLAGDSRMLTGQMLENEKLHASVEP